MASKIILPAGFGRQGSIDDYQPLDQKELGLVAQPVMNAIAQGVPPDAETMIQFGVLCRLLVTVKTLGMAGAAMEAERDALAKELADLKVAAPAPTPRLNLGFLSEQRSYTCPICERATDENGNCAVCSTLPDPQTRCAQCDKVLTPLEARDNGCVCYTCSESS